MLPIMGTRNSKTKGIVIIVNIMIESKGFLNINLIPFLIAVKECASSTTIEIGTNIVKNQKSTNMGRNINGR